MPQAPAALSRELVLRAALEIIDRDGVEGLTMRHLGHALRRDPMALYRYAANKNALLDGVVELVMSQARLDPSDPDWAGELRTFARAFRDIAIEHPHVVPLLVTRPLATPLALRPLGTLRPLEDTLTTYDGAAELERGLDILIDGLMSKGGSAAQGA